MPDVNEEATRRREEEEQKTVKTLQLMAEIVNGFSTKYEHRTFLLMVTTTRVGERETERECCLFFDALLTLIVEFNLSTRCTSRECTKCNIISLSQALSYFEQCQALLAAALACLQMDASSLPIILLDSSFLFSSTLQLVLALKCRQL